MGEPSHDGNDARPGQLRTYLGTAPGVGKTYAMLNDGRRRSDGGERVVVGWIERHDRAETRAQLRNLEIAPPRSLDYRGTNFEDLDVAAIMARQLDVVLIDELGRTRTRTPAPTGHANAGKTPLSCWRRGSRLLPPSTWPTWYRCGTTRRE